MSGRFFIDVIWIQSGAVWYMYGKFVYLFFPTQWNFDGYPIRAIFAYTHSLVVYGRQFEVCVFYFFVEVISKVGAVIRIGKLRFICCIRCEYKRRMIVGFLIYLKHKICFVVLWCSFIL